MASYDFLSLNSLFDQLSSTLSPGSSAICPDTVFGTGKYAPIYATMSYPASVDEAISLIRQSGESDSLDVFERAKAAYKSLPSFPAADIAVDKETGDLHFTLAVPGYDEDDIEVSFENDSLIIEIGKDNALRRQKDEEDTKFYIVEKLRASKVRWKAPVPFSHFKVKSTEAAYKNGLLSIHIPRNEDQAPHKVKLK